MRSAGFAGLTTTPTCGVQASAPGGAAMHRSYMDYLFHPAGHGLNLSRPYFDACLAEQCRSAGVQLLTGARLTDILRSARGWRAEVQCGDHVRTVRTAAGRRRDRSLRRFARLQGASIEARDSQVGLIAFRASNPAVDPAGGRVVIESAEHGWWYSPR